MSAASTNRASFADVLRNRWSVGAGIVTALAVLPALTMMKEPETGMPDALRTTAVPSADQLLEG